MEKEFQCKLRIVYRFCFYSYIHRILLLHTTIALLRQFNSTLNLQYIYYCHKVKHIPFDNTT